MSLVSPFFIIIRNIRDRRDSVIFYFWSLEFPNSLRNMIILISPALIRFFRYEISIIMDNHLKNTIWDSAK